MNWTTEKPTEPGWYWTWDFHFGWVDMVELEIQYYDDPSEGIVTGDLVVKTEGSGARLDKWTTHWMGPIPKPEPPL